MKNAHIKLKHINNGNFINKFLGIISIVIHSTIIILSFEVPQYYYYILY